MMPKASSYISVVVQLQPLIQGFIGRYCIHSMRRFRHLGQSWWRLHSLSKVKTCVLKDIGLISVVGIMIDTTINNWENYSSVPQRIRRVDVHVLKVSTWENKVSTL